MSGGPVLGCIADDFTGASDLAALLARSGIAVSLHIGQPDHPPEPGNLAAVEVIALKIRSAPRGEAVAAALAAHDWLSKAGAKRFYWKYCSTFDSTDAGNIGPVAEALMDRTGAEQTLYVPSFPQNGRRVFMGNLFVGRQPLAESPMKDHPLTPMRDSDLTRVLAPQVSGKVGLIDLTAVAAGAEAVANLMAGSAPHLIADAVSDADLAVLAEAVHDLPLLTGGSAFAGALPDRYRAAGLLSEGAAGALPDLPDGPAIVLSGSCSAMTRRQVKDFTRKGPSLKLDPLELAERGDAAMLDWLTARKPGETAMIYATAEPEEVRAAQSELGVERAGKVVEEALASAATAAREAGITRFVIAGGETSGAVSQALGVNRVDVGTEIAPGVPWCVAEDAAGRFSLALKSGNFGDEDFFSRALGLR